MAMPIPAGVAFSYNGIVFPANIKTEVNDTPVTSGDNRVVKFTERVISVSGFITQDEAGGLVPLDALMRIWRTSLEKHGKTLLYVNKGFGTDLTINAAGGGGMRDVNMGPKAGKFTWSPLGGAPTGCFAAKFNWSVTTWIPECTTAHYLPGKGVFTEISFTVAYAQDEAGLTTITTTGNIEIPLSLQLNNTLTTNVDQFFADAIARVPDGFIRTAQRQISADRRSCSFTLTDKQIEICYPNDVVLISADHRVKDMGSGTFSWGTGIRWSCSFTGTVRMNPTAAPSLSWLRFRAIILDRMDRTRATVGLNANGTPTGRNCFVTAPSVEFTENLFKNESRFNVRYFILGGATLATIFAASGLWQPVKNNTNFGLWSASLQGVGNAQQQGGGMVTPPKFGTDQEVIIDVCSSSSAGDVGGGDWGDDDSPGRNNALAGDAALINAAAANASEPETLMGDAGDAGGGDFGSPGDEGSVSSAGGTQILGPNPGNSAATGSLASGVIAPDPGSSWLHWTCTVERFVDHHVIRHKPLAGTVTYNALPFDPMDLEATANDTSEPGFKVGSSVADIVQQTSSPSVTLTLTGTATRLLYRANPPKLISFGGTTPILQHEKVRETVLAAPGGLMTYRTDWELTYIINSIVDVVDLPANPMLGTDGQI